ncbi:MAG TPA: DMT family transporter [Cyclobacteriaceae bacterium]
MQITKGVRYMLVSTLFFTGMNLLVKMVPNIPAIEIVFFRSLVSLVLSYGFLARLRISVWGNNKKLLIGRGISGAVALILYFTTLQVMPLASAVTIQFLSPIFTTILGIFVVREKVKPWQWAFFAIAFGGVLVIEGFDPRVSAFFGVIGIISALFSGFTYNLIRKMGTSEHPLVIVFYFPLVTLPVTGIYCYFFWVNPIGMEWLLLILIGVMTQFAQYFMTMAYQNEELSKVAPLKYFGVLYAIILGYVFFGETFNWLTYTGMIMVIVGVILNVWYKQRLTSRVI